MLGSPSNGGIHYYRAVRDATADSAMLTPFNSSIDLVRMDRYRSSIKLHKTIVKYNSKNLLKIITFFLWFIYLLNFAAIKN